MTLLQRSIQAIFKQNVVRPPTALGSDRSLVNLIGGGGGSNQISQMQAMTQTAWLFSVVDRLVASQ